MDPSSVREPGNSDVSSRIAKIEPRPARRSRSKRTWLEGSRTARWWNTELIGWAALSVGAGVILAVAARTLVPGINGSLLAGVAVWIGMAVPVVIAMRRGVPRGLMRFKAVDLLYAVVLGGALRVVQGWLEVAAGGTGALPSYGSLNSLWWLDASTAVIVSPALEELLFRGVVLVAVYRIARRGFDGAVLAVVASTAAFVAMHVITSGLSGWDQPVALTIVGATLGTLVILTGRLWPAILVHVVYNLSGVGLALIGTAFA